MPTHNIHGEFQLTNCVSGIKCFIFIGLDNGVHLCIQLNDFQLYFFGNSVLMEQHFCDFHTLARTQPPRAKVILITKQREYEH